MKDPQEGWGPVESPWGTAGVQECPSFRWRGESDVKINRQRQPLSAPRCYLKELYGGMGVVLELVDQSSDEKIVRTEGAVFP